MKPKYIISSAQIDELFKKLQAVGYQLLGPTLQDKAIGYDKINKVADLPIGCMDQHDRGSYKVIERSDKALFGYNVGPHTWKKFLFPPMQTIFTADKSSADIKVKVSHDKEQKFALIGVRACELHAIKIQDKVFAEQEHTDHGYTKRRKDAFILAVNCTTAGATCFCTTMNTGPKVAADFDLALTEVILVDKHYFLLDVGSELGDKLTQGLSLKIANEIETAEATKICKQVEEQIKIKFDSSKVKDLLLNNLESPLWDELDKRCLSCANCTLVCPTCFCSEIEDSTNLSGTESKRSRKWDSCFNDDFTYMHGGPIRKSIKSKYRHWITHKLANWQDQFGTSGCVGCGRCISWCPVGIDITEEVVKLQELENKG